MKKNKLKKHIKQLEETLARYREDLRILLKNEDQSKIAEMRAVYKWGEEVELAFWYGNYSKATVNIKPEQLKDFNHVTETIKTNSDVFKTTLHNKERGNNTKTESTNNY